MKTLALFLICFLGLHSLKAQLLVANINSANQSSSPNNFWRWSEGILFIANSNVYGNELFIVSEDRQAPEVLSNVNPSGGSNYLYDVSVIDDQVYFITHEFEASVVKIWKIDLETRQTILLSSYTSGAFSSQYTGGFTKVGDKVFFYIRNNNFVLGNIACTAEKVKHEYFHNVFYSFLRSFPISISLTICIKSG